MSALNFITICWVVFVVYWMERASKVKKTAKHMSLGSRLAYQVWLWVAIVLLFLKIPPPPFSILVVPHSLAVDVVSCLLCLLGLGVTIWARRTLAGNWSAEVAFKENHELITRGPYRLVRHPIYTGLLAMFCATALAHGRLDGLVGILFCVLGFWLKLKQEEKLMLEHFPDEYPAYQQRVKALVPYVL